MDSNKVLVAMSGGVDSSTSAALMKEKGYEVVGVTFNPFFVESVYDKSEFKPDKAVEDAKAVCDELGIPHIEEDYFEFFSENVIDYFIESYLRGYTPNPCVLCNPILKWGKLLEKADEIGAKYLATGHYVNTVYDENTSKRLIAKAKDSRKDQSYFLWRLNQEQISRTIFPLGAYVKEEARRIAKNLGLKVHDKSESQEVCFVADGDYKRFLKKAVPDRIKKISEGDIVFRGEVIGKHAGYPFYTVGQRRGLGVSHKQPLYVINIDAENNVIEVGLEEQLYRDGLFAGSINIVGRDSLDGDIDYTVKIRYKDKGSKAKCETLGDGRIRVKFYEKRRAITPGQSAVIYEGERLIGGGIIESAF